MENDHKVLHRDAGQHSPLSVEEMHSLGCQGGQAAPSEGENRSLDVASSGQPTRYWWDGGGCSFFFFFLYNSSLHPVCSRPINAFIPKAFIL